LTEARNFARDGFFEHGFFLPEYDYPFIDADLEGVHPDTFPTTSIVTGFFFKIFGIKLVVARLVNILFIIGSILFMYLLTKKLFKRQDLALVTALVFALNPLTIFFGRNTQLINPALFFMIAGAYFFLFWRENLKEKFLLLTAIFITLSVITKYSFGLILIPILLTIPYKKVFAQIKKDRKKLVYYAISILIFLTIGGWIKYTAKLKGTYVVKEALSGVTIKLGVAFQSEFWETMKYFFMDNYTLIGVFFAIIGLVLLIFLLIFMKKKQFGYWFIISYVIGTLIWWVVMSEKLSGHNYHQYPIVPLVVFLMAYCFVVIGTNVEKIVKIKYSRWIIITIFILLLIKPIFFTGGGGVFVAKDRMFDTQFFGLDLAGEYIKANSAPDERLFHSSHQSYGVLWHADRKGYKMGTTVDEIKKGEGLNASWIFLYQWGLEVMQDEERWDYIKNNYELKQMALQQTEQGMKPIYMLFKEGGSFNESMMNNIHNSAIQIRNYELTKGQAQIGYVNFD